MVSKVNAFKTRDGSLFEKEVEAALYDMELGLIELGSSRETVAFIKKHAVSVIGMLRPYTTLLPTDTAKGYKDDRLS